MDMVSVRIPVEVAEILEGIVKQRAAAGMLDSDSDLAYIRGGVILDAINISQKYTQPAAFARYMRDVHGW